jgi:hypothetical protein
MTRKFFIALFILVAVGSTVWACCKSRVAVVRSCAQVQVAPRLIQQAPVIRQEVVPAPMPPPAPVIERKEVQTVVPQPPVTVTERTYTVPQAPIVQSQVFASQTFATSPVFSQTAVVDAPLLLRARPILFPRLFLRSHYGAVSYGCCGGVSVGVLPPGF